MELKIGSSKFNFFDCRLYQRQREREKDERGRWRKRKMKSERERESERESILTAYFFYSKNKLLSHHGYALI